MKENNVFKIIKQELRSRSKDIKKNMLEELNSVIMVSKERIGSLCASNITLFNKTMENKKIELYKIVEEDNLIIKNIEKEIENIRNMINRRGKLNDKFNSIKEEIEDEKKKIFVEIKNMEKKEYENIENKKNKIENEINKYGKDEIVKIKKIIKSLF